MTCAIVHRGTSLRINTKLLHSKKKTEKKNVILKWQNDESLT